jgi:hypothetical protein
VRVADQITKRKKTIMTKAAGVTIDSIWDRFRRRSVDAVTAAAPGGSSA